MLRPQSFIHFHLPTFDQERDERSHKEAASIYLRSGLRALSYPLNRCDIRLRFLPIVSPLAPDPALRWRRRKQAHKLSMGDMDELRKVPLRATLPQLPGWI